MPDPAVARFRRRALIVFAAIGVVGFGSGALANQGVARLLRLPDDAKPPTYADVEPPKDDAAADGQAVDDAGDEAPEAAPSRPRPRALSKKQYADVIVRRNIFDSTAVYNPAAEAAGGDGTCTSDGNLRLLATMVVDPPEYSSALVAMGGKDGKADGYAMGDDLGTLGRIVLIEQNKVCGDGGACVCIGTEGVGAPDKRVLAKGDKAEGDGDVEKLGDNKFAVEQSVLDNAMNNFESLAGQIRVVPHKDASGQIDGYRLSAIRRGSLFDKLGIKNGDIVHGVNGNPLTSTEGALSVYQTLRNERSFSFDLTRRNQRVTMEYEVR